MGKLKRRGYCHRCGDCCRRLAVSYKVPETGHRREETIKFIEDHAGVYQIIEIEQAPDIIIIDLEMPCKHMEMKKDLLGRELSSCKIYGHRPQVCRQFPKYPSPICRYFKFTVNPQFKIRRRKDEQGEA